jgi:molecular chaperone GrpE
VSQKEAKSEVKTDPEIKPEDTSKSNGTQQPGAPTVEQLQTQLKEQEAKYLYLYAEFENFKKRMQKERQDLLKFGWEQVARDLLQVLDNIERVQAHLPANTDKTLSEGLRMVVDEFKSTLQKQGLQGIESIAKPFDPHIHEAISQESSDQPEGTIISELSRGYTLNGRLLRPARVTVSNGKKAE